MPVAVPRCIAALAVALILGVPAQAQNYDDAVKVFAANITKTTPFSGGANGYGIYLGNGAFLSAAHVIGRWPALTKPRVLIGGLDLPAKVIKMGDADTVDVTLVGVDEKLLPLSLRMRRNPLCRTAPVPGEEVFAVVPEKVVRTTILSPRHIAPNLRRQYDTLTSELATLSGSGIFRASTKCLHGIMSRSVTKYKYVSRDDGQIVTEPDGHAGYFVPAAQILNFLPEEYRF